MNHTAKKTHHFFQNEQIPIKYWAMRHMLFSKFDSGIQLDQGNLLYMRRFCVFSF